jgi:hypothetical protein
MSMPKTPIYNARKLVMGYIEEDGKGKQTAFDARMLIVGYYDASSNQTFNKNRTLYGQGNQLMALIPQRP